MITYLIMDILFNNVFNISSYFIIGHISKHNILKVIVVAIFYDLYYLICPFYYLIIFSIIIFINILFLSKKNNYLRVIINYLVFFLFNTIVYHSILPLNVILITLLWISLYIIINHIIRIANIYINR